MSDVWLNIVMVVVFVLIGGAFAGAEIALVSLRESQVRALAEKGKRGQSLSTLLATPNRFLAAVQVGVTLAGFFSAAFGASTLSAPLGEWLIGLGLSEGLANPLSFVLVTIAISYLSLVVGELTPKRLALQRAEGFSLIVAAPLNRIATVFRPIIWLLSKSTDVLVRLLGGDPKQSGESISQEELRDLVAAHESLSSDERRLIDEVFRAGDREVREVMTPRTEVDWLDCRADAATIREKLITTQHTRLPVGDGSIDTVAGVVQARDIAAALLRGEPLDLNALMRKAPVVIDQIDAPDALLALRQAEVPMALIHDEYGHFEGIVTPADLLAAIGGAFFSDADPDEAPDIVERDDGSLLVAGTAPADGLAERIGIDLPEDRDYATVAGLALAAFRHLPAEGESFVEQGWRFEVVDLDGRRIDKLLVSVV